MHAYGTGSSLPAYGPTVLRLALGAVFIAHGAHKLFGSAGLENAATAPMVTGLVEFGGGILLVLGALTVAAAFALTMATLLALWWVQPLSSEQAFVLDFGLVRIGGLVCLMLTGAGALSIDGRRAESAASEAAGRARLRAGKV